MTSSSEETEENHNSIPTGIPQESQILAVGMRLDDTVIQFNIKDLTIFLRA